MISAGARWKRKVPGARLTSIALVISIALVVTATSLSSSTASIARVKIALFYLAIAVEMATVWFQVVWGVSGPPASDEYISERYGALSLIILGEGFLSLTRAFGNALSTLVSEANFAFYLQVFLIIFVIFCIWTFLFFHFRKTDTISNRRSALWEIVHFPLHFAILLLQAAMIVSASSSWCSLTIRTTSRSTPSRSRSSARSGTLTRRYSPCPTAQSSPARPSTTSRCTSTASTLFPTLRRRTKS